MTNIDKTNKFLEGYFTVADAVSKTMGKEGKYAVIEQFMGMPIVTKDGVTVARNINFSADDNQSEAVKNERKEQQLGASLIKQACVKSLLVNGDGTSTAACLAASIVRSCFVHHWLGKKRGKYLFNKKVEKGMQVAFEEICRKLNWYSKSVTDEDLEKIASISANNDSEIGKIILQAFKAVGKTGIISVRDGVTTALDIFKGMRINKGFVSPFLINNEKNGTYQAVDCNVLVYAGYEIHNSEEVKNYINATKGKPLLIVVEKMNSEDWIRNIYRVNVQGGYNVTVIEAPNYDVKREALLEDIALYTGGEVFHQGTSKEIVAGVCDEVIVEQNFTSFIKKEVSDAVKEKIVSLTSQLETSSDPQFINERIQALEGVSATITVGAQVESEGRELKDRFDDAVGAIKSAVEQGWIAGGGSTFVKISGEMKQTFKNSDIEFGYNAMKSAIQAPFRQICDNADRNYADYILSSLKEYGVGYNAHTDELSNLIEDGVIDSCKATVTSLENAFSVAKLVLNTRVIITN